MILPDKARGMNNCGNRPMGLIYAACKKESEREERWPLSLRVSPLISLAIVLIMDTMPIQYCTSSNGLEMVLMV